MRKTSAILCSVACLGLGFIVPVNAQTTLASWTFETNTPADLTNSTTGPTVAAESGSGSLSGYHSSVASDWSTPAGNASANSYSVNTWSVGDYFQFQVSTTGYQSLIVTWDQTSSATGPNGTNAFTFQYSLDGISFINVSSYNVGTNSWSSSGSPAAASQHSIALTSIAAINNQNIIYFRLTNNETVGAGGTDKIDNISITAASAVPEPSTYAALMGALALAGVMIVRHRKRIAA